MPIASIKSILKVFTLRLVSYTLSPIFDINSDLFKCLTTCNTLITNTLRFFLSRYSVQRCSLSVWWPSRTSGTWTPARAWFRSVWVCPCLWLAWPTTLTVGTPSTLLVTWVPGCLPSPQGGATVPLRKSTSRDWNSFYIVLTNHLHCFHFYQKSFFFFLNVYVVPIVMNLKWNTSSNMHWLIMQKNEHNIHVCTHIHQSSTF